MAQPTTDGRRRSIRIINEPKPRSRSTVNITHAQNTYNDDNNEYESSQSEHTRGTDYHSKYRELKKKYKCLNHHYEQKYIQATESHVVLERIRVLQTERDQLQEQNREMKSNYIELQKKCEKLKMITKLDTMSVNELNSKLEKQIEQNKKMEQSLKLSNSKNMESMEHNNQLEKQINKYKLEKKQQLKEKNHKFVEEKAERHQTLLLENQKNESDDVIEMCDVLRMGLICHLENDVQLIEQVTNEVLQFLDENIGVNETNGTLQFLDANIAANETNGTLQFLDENIAANETLQIILNNAKHIICAMDKIEKVQASEHNDVHMLHDEVKEMRKQLKSKNAPDKFFGWIGIILAALFVVIYVNLLS